MTSGRGLPAKTVSFCSLMAALGTALMLLGGLIPIFTYCSPLLASLCLIPVCVEAGRGPGWCVWAVAAFLSLIIGVDKEAAFFYCFFGFYPLIKPFFDKLKPKALRFTAKAVFFALLTALMYWLLCFVLGIDEILESFSAVMWLNIAVLAGIVVVLVLFDKVYDRFKALYVYRLRPKLSFLNK